MLKKFDWVIWDTFVDFKGISNPRSVLVYPGPPQTDLHEPLSQIPTLLPGEKRSLAIYGDDFHLSYVLKSKAVDLNVLTDRFSFIFCTAKNIYSSKIQTIPVGLHPFYVLKSGVERVRCRSVLFCCCISPHESKYE